jgi:ATP-dependent Lon protease
VYVRRPSHPRPLHSPKTRTAEQPSGGGGGRPKDMTKKAVLLSGPPGIGKTSAAHIIAK